VAATPLLVEPQWLEEEAVLALPLEIAVVAALRIAVLVLLLETYSTAAHHPVLGTVVVVVALRIVVELVPLESCNTAAELLLVVVVVALLLELEIVAENWVARLPLESFAAAASTVALDTAAVVA